jgi:hypothetical protein
MKSFATFYPQSRRAPAATVCAFDTCTMRMTVDAGSITTLRQLAMRVCGEALEFMRIARCAGGDRIRVWLCVRLPFAALLRETILRQLPGAEFKLQPALPVQPGEAA